MLFFILAFVVPLQAMSMFSSALASGQLGPLMNQFGLPAEAVDAANKGGQCFAHIEQRHCKCLFHHHDTEIWMFTQEDLIHWQHRNRFQWWNLKKCIYSSAGHNSTDYATFIILLHQRSKGNITLSTPLHLHSCGSNRLDLMHCTSLKKSQ